MEFRLQYPHLLITLSVNPGNANGVVGVFLLYSPERKILKIPPQKIWEKLKNRKKNFEN